VNSQLNLSDLSPVLFVKLEDRLCHEYLAKELVQLSKISFTSLTIIQEAAEVVIVPEEAEVVEVLQILASRKRNRKSQSK
jgi:hypothetical protein